MWSATELKTVFNIIAIYWHFWRSSLHPISALRFFLHPNYKNALYFQVGTHTGADLNNQTGISMQVERRPAWMPGQPENPSSATQLPGPPPMGAGQMGSSSQQPPRPPQVTILDFSMVLVSLVRTWNPQQFRWVPKFFG